MNRRIAIAIATSALAATVEAQSLPPGTTVSSAALAGITQFDTDFDSGGSFRRSEVVATGELLHQFTPRLAAGLSLRYQSARWSFDQPKAFGGRAPWGDIQAPQIGATFLYAPTEDWRILVAPTIEWSYEDGASAGDAQIYGAVVIASKVFSPTLTLGAGGAVFRQLYQTKVYPFVTVDWRINDRWRLSNPLPAGPAGGAGLELTYKPGEGWETGFGGAYRRTVFRLNGEGAVPGGIGEQTGTPLFLRIGHDFSKQTRFDFYAIALVNGKLAVDNPNGDEVVSEGYKVAPALALSLRHRF